MLNVRHALGLLVLVALACEAKRPPSQSGAEAQPPSGQAPSPAAGADPSPSAEPAPPPEPPWDTAAGVAYRELMPPGAEPNAPLPMVVAIHGRGDSPDNFKHLLDGFPEPVRVIVPRGLDAFEGGDGWEWFPVSARDPDVEGLSAGIRSAADRLAAAIEQLAASRPTVGKPIVTGFSQGGMLTFTLAVHHPEVVGQAIAVGGWLPPPLVPQARAPEVEYPPIHALHGTADPAVAFEPTQVGVQALVELGLKAELTPYEGVGHVIPPPMRRDLYDRLTDAVKAEQRRKP